MSRIGRLALITVVAVMALTSGEWAQELHTTPSDASTPFPPFEQWKSAVLAGDATGLRALYSADPAAQVNISRVTHDADADTSFWIGLKARSMNIEIIRQIVRPEIASIIFRADVASGLPNAQTVTVTDDQYWRKQGDQWHLLGVERTDAPQLKQPSDMKKNIYPAEADAHAEIKEAEEKASRGHKRVLLVFGANWCFDCHVLDLAFQRPDLAPVLVANYEVVHVDLGPDEHKNADIVKQFDAVLNKGIPTLAVAESDGTLVVSQKNGEFEDARGLTPDVLLEFLNRWKPGK
ncbi:MAG TPA: thioredoxin family protein [Candidatus Sulfotelmatobacter sp.]|jgi:thioredoxin-related protein